MTARLTDAERRELTATLRKRRQTLGAEIAHKVEAQDNPALLTLRNRMEETDDWAVADLETALDIAEVSRDTVELREVDAALTRMRDGTYGDCVECGQAIPYARLAANPSAARCIACQERAEAALRRGPPASL
ncbi:MAG: TraR/DksA C4-type zinc finger protein [Burkholderiales bacterium]|nr:TraR/DksA C4-type zinc finger protein [Burkholderiales bacterium]